MPRFLRLAIACDNAAMASLIRETNGTYRLSFVDCEGSRRSLRIGKTTEVAALTFKCNIELLVADSASGSQQPPELAAWLERLSLPLRNKLARCNLVRSRAHALTVDELVVKFASMRAVKPATLAAYRQTTNSLRGFFGEHLAIRQICTSDAERWQRSLADEGLAPATRAKRTIVAKAIFRRAVTWGSISKSPFDHLKAGSQSNPARSVYVSRSQFADVMAFAPSAEWRALISVCRFAGLRCPSEVRELRWRDIDFERGAMTVRSPKTESYAGHAVRLVPMDPTVASELSTLRTHQADADAVFAGLASQVSLRTQFHRIIKRAGHQPWPRLFQNLRASCATDWVERFPAHEVAKWLGHSPLVAQQHYLMPNDLHFQAASHAQTRSSSGSGDPVGVETLHQLAGSWRRLGAASSGQLRTSSNASHEDERGYELPEGISQPRSSSLNGRYWTRRYEGNNREW